MTDPTRVDNTILSAVAKCDLDAVIQYVHHQRSKEEAAHLKAGFAGHEALASWFRGEGKVRALDALYTTYHDWAMANVPSDDRLSWENVERIMKAWFDANPQFPFQIIPELVETGVEAPLDDTGEFVMVGRLDLFAWDLRDSNTYVVDNKFPHSINKWWAKQFRMSSQLSGYQWMAKQHLGDDANVVGSYINAVELSKLPSDPTRRCPTHKVPYLECGALHAKSELLGPFFRTPEQLENWRMNAIQLAKKFRTLKRLYRDWEFVDQVEMRGQFNYSCKDCACFAFCTDGRPLGHADNYFSYDPWEPWAGAISGKQDVEP